MSASFNMSSSSCSFSFSPKLAITSRSSFFDINPFPSLSNTCSQVIASYNLVSFRNKCTENWVRIHQPFSRTFFVCFSKICKFECNTTSDWINRTVYPIRSCVTFKCLSIKKTLRTRQRMFLKMVGEYGPGLKAS